MMNLSNEVKKETKRELFASLDKLKLEANSLRKELNKVDNEKESWFRKKEEMSEDIRGKIESIQENRTKRDALTKKVKELKEKRSNFNQETKKKISALIKLKEKARGMKKIEDPRKIKGEIDKIEVKLETEAMSFEKEKELSKKLKQLKKSLEEAYVTKNFFDNINKLSLEIDTARENTNHTHNEIQKLAKESQELHEAIIKNSEGIDKLKITEEEAFKNFANFKKSFNDINNMLKEKLSEMNVIRKKINKFELEENEKRRLRESMIIKSKEQEIEEKIKGGKKLTTDDFLVFQEAIKSKKDL